MGEVREGREHFIALPLRSVKERFGRGKKNRRQCVSGTLFNITMPHPALLAPLYLI